MLKKFFSKSQKKSQNLQEDNAELPSYINESYSQQGEDAVLFGMLNYSHSGFYVDVGAHHPKRFSNSFKFYKMGWSGINIDPMPQMKLNFDKERPRDINIEVGIAEEEGVLNYYMFEESALNTFDEKTVKYFQEIYPSCKILEINKIPVTTLAKCLDQNMPPNVNIDFMSVDCEGLDFEVLKSNNWNKYKPKIIVCEIHDMDIESVSTSEIGKYLKNLGYKFEAKTGLSSFFILQQT